MKGYESIPTIAVDDEASSSVPSFQMSPINNRRQSGLKWIIATATLLMMVFVAPLLLNDGSSSSVRSKMETWGSSLRSASVVMLPDPPLTPKPSKDKIYNNNTHVKLLSFKHQKVNHFRDDTYKKEPEQYWSQPYYQTTEYWKGPGSPIFCIIGGEAVQQRGIIYPIVPDMYAKHFGAAVIQPEHRFYGVEKPVSNATKEQLLELLTVPQALADVVHFVQHVRKELGCSLDKSSKHYCPVITVGGSYAAFLSAMSRMVYPDFIDMAYSSSGPILMYGQMVDDPNVYYDIMTDAYDHASPGCAAAIKHTLYAMNDTIQQVFNETGSLAQAAEAVGLCGVLPEYITTPNILADAIVEVSSSRFQ
jgi:hypothetical protein